MLVMFIFFWVGALSFVQFAKLNIDQSGRARRQPFLCMFCDHRQDFRFQGNELHNTVCDNVITIIIIYYLIMRVCAGPGVRAVHRC